MELLKVMELEGSGEGTTKRRVVIVECGELDESGAVKSLPSSSGAAAGASGSSELDAGGDGAAKGGADEADETEVDDEGPVLETGPPEQAGGGGGENDDGDDDGPMLEEQ